MRTLAIGDIHGCRTALDHLLALVNPLPGETIISLGDYVDRGPDSKGVIDKLIEMRVAGQLIPLRGNHEFMMLGAKEGGADSIRFWLACGGVPTLESYVPAGQIPLLEDIPATHWHFIKHTCDDWYETDTHIFVHANLHPERPLALDWPRVLTITSVPIPTFMLFMPGMSRSNSVVFVAARFSMSSRVMWWPIPWRSVRP